MFDFLDNLRNDDVTTDNSIVNNSQNDSNINNRTPADIKTPKFFDIALFEKELFNSSDEANREHQKTSTSINAYDLIGCIRAALFKFYKYPVESFADRWLPVRMRTSIGRAIHSFIQDNTNQFTETEVYIKVPSLHFSGRVDAIINDNVLIEIKSCPYSDYQTIINTKRPRSKDFYQSIIYKYFLENYCSEIKEYCKNNEIRYGGHPPKLDHYNFTNIQFIYVAHDIISADTTSLSEALHSIKQIKKNLGSKKNKFFFITSLIIDSRNDNVKDALMYIIDRIVEYNKYIEANKIPPLTHKYVDKKSCFFCIYRNVCREYH